MADTINFQGHELTYPCDQIGKLREANDLLKDADGLHERIKRYGYLLIRGLISKEKVLKARQSVIEIANKDDVFKHSTDLMDAVAGSGNPGGTMGNKTYTHHSDVLSVLEGEELFHFFKNFFGSDTRTFDYKWLRFKAPNDQASEHRDNKYMTGKRVLTCWVPFGDIPVRMGSLALKEGSHKGNIGKWKTTDFEIGDVIIFTMRTLHCTTKNLTRQWRISCDVRFQPAGDPIDARWVDDV